MAQDDWMWEDLDPEDTPEARFHNWLDERRQAEESARLWAAQQEQRRRAARLEALKATVGTILFFLAIGTACWFMGPAYLNRDDWSNSSFKSYEDRMDAAEMESRQWEGIHP